jgi:hypothetical protein
MYDKLTNNGNLALTEPVHIVSIEERSHESDRTLPVVEVNDCVSAGRLDLLDHEPLYVVQIFQLSGCENSAYLDSDRLDDSHGRRAPFNERDAVEHGGEHVIAP